MLEVKWTVQQIILKPKEEEDDEKWTDSLSLMSKIIFCFPEF